MLGDRPGRPRASNARMERKAGWRPEGIMKTPCTRNDIDCLIGTPSSSHPVIRILEDQGQVRLHSPVHQRFTARRPRDAFSSRALRTGSRFGQADDIGLPGPRTIGQALFFCSYCFGYDGSPSPVITYFNSSPTYFTPHSGRNGTWLGEAL